MSFAGDIRRFNTKTERATEMIFRGTSLMLFARIIARSPVLTGRFRANWNAQINSSPSQTTTESDRSGGKAIGKASNVTARARLGDKIYFMNNLPYGGVLEDGSSDQAPNGMVKVTVSEFQNIVRRAV